jgi:membrane associated rhomboid family serine protease
MKQKAKFCHKCGAAQDPDEEEKIHEHYKQWYNKKAENDKKVPYFIVIWPTIVFGMWFFGAYANSLKEINQGKSFAELEGGLDTINPGSTIMEIHRECDDLRLGFLFYRSWLYQCTHLSFTHVMGNCLVTWFLGIGLERLHGTSAMCVFFFCGVIGGAAFFSFSDAHRVVAGMSGGVYSVLGMRIGNLALNWGEKRQPCLELLLIMFWLGWEGIHYYHLVVEEGKRSQFSWSTHIGGMYTGGLILFLFGHNAVKKRWETHLRHCAWPGLVAVPVFAICWSIPWPPRTIFHTTPWCWKKLVYNRTAFNDRAWHCVNCGNADDSSCISEWSTNLYTESVTLDNCQDMYGWGYEELGDPQWNVSSVAP